MISNLRKQLFERKGAAQRHVPIYLCCHHKVGTVLLVKIFRNICVEFGWRFKGIMGQCEQAPTDADVVVFVHSLVNFDSATRPYVGAHFIRDPRDVIVSGYLYHKRCTEEWCTNTDHEPGEPILYPKVPFSQEHRSEEWKRRYLASLSGKSYQQNLCDLDESDGLLFEMSHYGAWTIESMLDWNYRNPNIEEIQFETLMSNFDETFNMMFERFGFTGEQMSKAMKIVAREDLNRMTEKEIRENRHISSRQVTKWKDYFTDVHKQAFRDQFGDALVQLGYETSVHW